MRGETIEVLIRVENVANLAGAEIHLSFDPTILEVIDAKASDSGVQISDGTLLSPDFTALNQVDNAAGTIDYAIVQIGRKEVAGEGVLATIDFRGKASGEAAITFRGIQAAPSGAALADAAGRPITAALESIRIAVK